MWVARKTGLGCTTRCVTMRCVRRANTGLEAGDGPNRESGWLFCDRERSITALTLVPGSRRVSKRGEMMNQQTSLEPLGWPTLILLDSCGPGLSMETLFGKRRFTNTGRLASRADDAPKRSRLVTCNAQAGFFAVRFCAGTGQMIRSRSGGLGSKAISR